MTTTEQFKCTRCQNFSDESYGEVEDEEVCECCHYESHTCDECDSKSWETVSVEGSQDGRVKDICQGCVESETFVCNDCGDRRMDCEQNVTNRSNTVCDDCYSENYFCCESCDNTYHNNDYGTDGRCESCTDEEDESQLSGELSDYNQKNMLDHQGKGRVKFGIEIELDEADIGCLNFVRSNLSNCIYKEDSSIEQGFEIVSAPACIASHKENFNEYFFKNLIHESYEIHNKCGMHIHASRAGMNDKQISRMALFIAAKSTQGFLDSISGRKENGYCLRRSELKSNKEKIKLAKGTRGAINVCEKTVEFRLFKSPESFEDFCLRLEFVSALVRWSAKFRTKKDFLASFKQYVVSSKNPNWPNLLEAVE